MLRFFKFPLAFILVSHDCGHNRFDCMFKMREKKYKLKSRLMRINHDDGKENSGITLEPLALILFLEMLKPAKESLLGGKCNFERIRSKTSSHSQPDTHFYRKPTK